MRPAGTQTFESESAIDRIFGPFIRPRTWLNILYLLVSFPLGVFYFVVMVTVFSTGLGLLPIFVGLFVLWFGTQASYAMAELERIALNTMLGAAIPPPPPAPPAEGGMFRKMGAVLRRPGTVNRAVYLLLRMPLGIISLSLVCCLLPLSFALLLLPFYYSFVPVTFGFSRVTSFEEAIYLSCFGAVLLLASVHVLNSWASVCRRFGQTMLS